MIQLRLSKFVDDGETSQPQLKECIDIQMSLGLVQFEQVNNSTTFALLDKFFCWTGQNTVHFMNIETAETAKIDQITTHVVVDQCNPRSLIESGWLRKVD